MATILVIDDDEATCKVLARALASRGHRTLEAADGRKGVAMAVRELPTLVITDIVMPDQEGIQTIIELRAAHPTLAIIAISGTSSTPIYAPLQDAKELGADAVLQKPFDIEALLNEVEALLSRGERRGD